MYYQLPRHKLIKVLLQGKDKPWVLDTETNGLNVMGPNAEHYAWWIGLSPLGSPDVLIIELDDFEMWGLRPLIEDLHLVGHNLRFDLHALSLRPKHLWKDTMVAAYYGHTSGKRSMDHLARVNGWHNIETPAALKQGRIADVPEDVLFPYLENDCIVTSKLAQRYSRVQCDFDYRVEQAVYMMECRGLRLLEENFAPVTAEVDVLICESLAQLRSFGLEGSADSPMQVADWLEKQGRRLPKTATGKASTSKLALQQLADKGDELADAVIRYRKATKLKSAFILPLPRLTQDGILYPRTNTTRTKTGRFSCDSPNLQQIPKRGPLGKALRACLTSPDNSGIISCDFSQVELRVAAAFAQEPTLLEAFAQGRCPHTEVAAKMVGKTIETVTPEERFKAKAVNFGILNGMGSRRLALELKTGKGAAARFLDDYRRNLPRLNAWMEGVWREAEAYGTAATVAGRTRIFTGKEDTRPAVSVVVQGSAAELMRHALVAAHDAGLEPLLSVHDEVLVGGRSPAKAAKLLEVMETAANSAFPESFSSVRFTAEGTSGETWGDA